MPGLTPIVVMAREPLGDLLAKVERDLDHHGRAKVIGPKRTWRRIKQFRDALDERIAAGDEISWASGGFDDGRVFVHVVRNDIGHPYSALYFLTEGDKPDWWRAMSVAVAGR